MGINWRAYIAELALIGATALWGSSFAAMKVAVEAFDPLLVILARMVLGSLVFAVMARRFGSVRSVYQKGDVFRILFMALCEPGLYFTCEAYAMQYTSASQAGMITAMLPIMVAVSAALLLKERMRAKAWFGLGLAALGVVWLTVSSTPDESAPNPVLGNGLELLAMVFATGYMISLKKLTGRYSPWFLTAMQSFIGCVYFLPALFFPWTEYPSTWEFWPVVSVFYLGLIVTIGGYGLYNLGMSHTQASRAASYINLIPVFAVLMGWWLLGESFSLVQIAASGLVFAGVFLSSGKSDNTQSGPVASESGTSDTTSFPT
ncbi:MAG: DMT family transporter [Desulfovibrio sp.]|nr:MAG: DMT family transporter [Desulfovibrio sp.]